MSPSDDAHPEDCADVIWEAWTTGARRAALPESIRPTNPDAGSLAQRALAERAGRRYGWKIAATSQAGQAHIRVDGPLPGPLFERFRYEPGAVLPSHDLHMRVVEAEFAFRMARDVPPDATDGDIVDAVAALHVAVELPDSRSSTSPRSAGRHCSRTPPARAGSSWVRPSPAGARTAASPTGPSAVRTALLAPSAPMTHPVERDPVADQAHTGSAAGRARPP